MQSIVEENELSNGFKQVIIRQFDDDGCREETLTLRNYYGNRVGISDGINEMLITGDAVHAIVKAIKQLSVAEIKKPK